MLLAFVEFGSLLFWALALLVFIVCVATVENEHGGWATLSLIAFVAVTHLFGDMNIFPWIVAHGLETAGMAALYFAIGAGYSVVKWRFFMSHVSTAYKKARLRFIRTECPLMPVDENTPVPDGFRERWSRQVIRVKDSTFYPSQLSKLELSDHKKRIVMWVTYWPFSAAWTLLNDPIRALAREIVERLSGLFRFIATSVLGKLSIDADIADDSPRETSTGAKRSASAK